MIARLITCDGRAVELPTLLQWAFTFTGGVPADSFSFTCSYHRTLAQLLGRVTRFRAIDGGETRFYGVVDEIVTEQSEHGLLLHVAGRGLAALLLDNEADAVSYQSASLAEMLRRHVTPYQIDSAMGADFSGAYRVASGSSEWKALEGFTLRYGGFSPYFTREGKLLAAAQRSDRQWHFTDASPLLSLQKREKRYGVISEVLVTNKTGVRRVKNKEFLQRGGCCRRVLYLPGQGEKDARYTGEYQIAQSAREQEQLTLCLQGAVLAAPGDTAVLKLARTGIYASCRIAEVEMVCDEAGERSTLTLNKE